MGSSSVPSKAISMATGRDEIYVATTPLRAMKGPPQLLMSAAYSLKLWNLQHFMLIIKPSISSRSMSLQSQIIVFDFQPQDPENIFVALAALSGKAIPGMYCNLSRVGGLLLAALSFMGTILERKISKIPKKRCWFIGSSQSSNAVEAAYKFNGGWDTDLRVGQHDCRHYTNELAEMLTGEKNVVQQLMNFNKNFKSELS